MNQPLDSIATVLESTGDYRVLRRLTPFVDCPDAPDEPTFIGLVLDTETTGTDFATDEVIELGILKFEYGASERIYRVLETFNQLHQPKKLIPPEITRLTGITDADVAGQRIDDAAVQAIAADAAVVIDVRIGIAARHAAVAFVPGLGPTRLGVLPPFLTVHRRRLRGGARGLLRTLQPQHQLNQFLLAQAFKLRSSHSTRESVKPNLHKCGAQAGAADAPRLPNPPIRPRK